MQTKRISTTTRRLVSSVGLLARYHITDAIRQLNGGMRVIPGHPSVGSETVSMFEQKYKRTLNCGSVERSKIINGSVDMTCGAENDIDLSTIQVWFNSTGFVMHRVWYTAPNKALYNSYMPQVMAFVESWLRARGTVAEEERRAAYLLGQTSKCRYGCNVE